MRDEGINVTEGQAAEPRAKDRSQMFTLLIEWGKDKVNQPQAMVTTWKRKRGMILGI